MKQTIRIKKRHAKRLMRAAGFDSFQELVVAALDVGLAVLTQNEDERVEKRREEPSA